jgi:hypothetical protein
MPAVLRDANSSVLSMGPSVNSRFFTAFTMTKKREEVKYA